MKGGEGQRVDLVEVLRAGVSQPPKVAEEARGKLQTNLAPLDIGQYSAHAVPGATSTCLAVVVPGRGRVDQPLRRPASLV